LVDSERRSSYCPVCHVCYADRVDRTTCELVNEITIGVSSGDQVTGACECGGSGWSLHPNQLYIDVGGSGESGIELKIECDLIADDIVAAGHRRSDVGDCVQGNGAGEGGDLKHEIFGVVVGPHCRIPYDDLVETGVHWTLGDDRDCELAVGLLRAEAELPTATTQLCVRVADRVIVGELEAGLVCTGKCEVVVRGDGHGRVANVGDCDGC